MRDPTTNRGAYLTNSTTRLTATSGICVVKFEVPEESMHARCRTRQTLSKLCESAGHSFAEDFIGRVAVLRSATSARL